MSMKNRANAVWCIANTPVCAGSGEGDFRADCNIQRSDDFPKIDAGTFKGSLLYKMDGKLKKIIQNQSPDQAKLSFSDLRLLFFFRSIVTWDLQAFNKCKLFRTILFRNFMERI